MRFSKFKVLILALLLGGLSFSCVEDIIQSTDLTNDEIISGLKQALTIGTDSTVKQLNLTDGYFKNQAIKVLFPKEAETIQSVVSTLPGGQALVDEFVVKMNRAAEDAAKEAKPIFVNAVTGMTINDGLGILQGGDTAATHYLRQKTYNDLMGLYKPKIENSMNAVGAQDAWKTLTETYNKVPFVKPVNTDISAYVTGRALSGLFVVVGEKERDIRKDPFKRVTDLLKKVFAKAK